MGLLGNEAERQKRVKLTGSEEGFLLAEFKKAWDMVFLLDERRIKILHFYSAVFAAIAAFVAKIYVDDPAEAVVPAVVALSAGALIGIAILFVLDAERKANIRYRRKINLIRGLFLEYTDNPHIGKYLEHRKLGIKTHRDPEQPQGWGSTLTRVLVIVILEIAALIVGAILLVLNGA